jgi:hypothetical protein
MKVTVLVAGCTLIVLLQQMQVSMAKPQVQVDPPPLFDTISESTFNFPDYVGCQHTRVQESLHAYIYGSMNYFSDPISHTFTV